MLQEGRIHKTWPIAQVSELHHARYLLQPRALELFMYNHTSALLSFETPKASGHTKPPHPSPPSAPKNLR